MPNLLVHTHRNSPNATAVWNGKEFSALIGRTGPIEADKKREGDGHTPLGRYPLLVGFYREDRNAKPTGHFPWRALQPGDAYSDDVNDPMYNQFIWQPHPCAEQPMYKPTCHHDYSIFIGYNVAPIVPGRGSALLLHCREPDQTYAAGCVALHKADYAKFVNEIAMGDGVDIRLS